MNRSPEPFDRRYLHALVEEGLNLGAFLDGWCQAMCDDLNRLRELQREGDFAPVPRLLHRLSGALGLVGAHSLMEALRQAQAAASGQDGASIDLLAERIQTLIGQLQAVRDEHGAACHD
ncbi:Hpt domain-containing protein [Paraburkholderia phenoliruptrix]|uniref:Hpt domain-containing protein n=1 Tax=Paraburkholderia phenoliruptrix TaxID=252970 RepID=UPI0011D24A45|nr:Hpt domain-containing protein [Paraburkholderia phenoliruptrix]MDR6423597.1 HPt (histidine-containing phosphotransfer) domain-containing protein [Paraburkholderia phenoliruptrix]